MLGVIHVKDLVDVPLDQPPDLKSLMRPVIRIPESIPIKQLLLQFQVSKQHIAFVMDERGTLVGFITLENILEQLVGPVEDEFDDEQPGIWPDTESAWIIQGATTIHEINRELQLQLSSDHADTISGLLEELTGDIPAEGSKITLDGATAEILEARPGRIVRLKLVVDQDKSAGDVGGSIG
jgi:magnesium and cobalt transporter